MYKNILNNLYNRKIKGGQSGLEAKFLEYSDTFDIELVNRCDKKVDCRVGHFGYNLYFRTSYGIKYKRYKNIYTLANSIKKVAKKYNLTLVNVGLKHNYKYKVLIKV